MSDKREGLIFGTRYKLPWSASVAFAQRCEPALSAFPPAVEARLRTLCDLYVIDADPHEIRHDLAGEPNLRPAAPAVSAGSAGSAGSGTVAADRVVADAHDLERWRDACEAYRAELGGAQGDLVGYWVQRRHQFPPSSWRRRRAFRQWQLRLATAYERLTAASDRFRPVFDELTAAIQETDRAYQDLTARIRRYHDWGRRTLWRMVPTPEGFLIGRSDSPGMDSPDTESAGMDPAGAASPRPLNELYESAKSERYVRLRQIDWDEASIRLCDGELAALAQQSLPVGRTRSGFPMADPAPASFADWFQGRFGGHHQRLSDRAALARERELSEARKASPRDTGPEIPRIGGYHTDPGSGHFGIHF
jgi:hypothetical protein